MEDVIFPFRFWEKPVTRDDFERAWSVQLPSSTGQPTATFFFGTPLGSQPPLARLILEDLEPTQPLVVSENPFFSQPEKQTAASWSAQIAQISHVGTILCNRAVQERANLFVVADDILHELPTLIPKLKGKGYAVACHACWGRLLQAEGTFDAFPFDPHRLYSLRLGLIEKLPQICRAADQTEFHICFDDSSYQKEILGQKTGGVFHYAFEAQIQRDAQRMIKNPNPKHSIAPIIGKSLLEMFPILPPPS